MNEVFFAEFSQNELLADLVVVAHGLNVDPFVKPVEITDERT